MSNSSKYDNTRAMYLLRNKLAFMRGVFYKGCHFGEMCLLSPISLQVSTAVADVNSEVYTLSKSELWKIFLFMPRVEQRFILIKLFTEVNGIQHSAFSEEILSSARLIGRSVTSTLDNLYELADSVLNEIIDEGIRQGNVHENVKHTEDVFYRILSKDGQNSTEMTCPWFEVLRAYEQKKVDMITSAASAARTTNGVSPTLSLRPEPTSQENDRKKFQLNFQNRSVSTVSDDLRQRIASLFRFMDLDGSGAISREELRTSLHSLGWTSVTWEFVDQLMADTVRNGDTFVHYDDLVEVICQALESENEKHGGESD
jgi:hypothetical protein